MSTRQFEPPPNQPRVVIVGAGFWGLYARERAAAGLAVTLIDALSPRSSIILVSCSRASDSS